MNNNGKIKKLPRAPLQEVIFEVRWQLDDYADSNQKYDEGYDQAIGMLKSHLQNSFPIIKSKFPPGLPYEFLNYKITHQYWTGNNEWPVIQLGPGIFTINETENKYEWESHFLPLIQKSLNLLKESYPKELKYNYAGLRYIDKIRTKDYNFSNWLGFIKENLNFEIHNHFDTRGELEQFSYNQVFKLKDSSFLQLTLKNGKNEKQEDVLVWETAILKIDKYNESSLMAWLVKAHNTTSDLFKEICKNEFYDSFR